MFNRQNEKHAGTNLGSATKDTNLANTQGSSSEAGHNSTITQPIEKPLGGPYDPEKEIIEKKGDEADSEVAPAEETTEYGDDATPEQKFVNNANAEYDKDQFDTFPEDDRILGDEDSPERRIPLV